MARRALQGMAQALHKKVQQRHGRLQINPLGVSVMPRIGVAALDKDAAIAFALRLGCEAPQKR